MSRLELRSGDTKTINVTVEDSSGDAKDITGSTIKWRLYIDSDTSTAKVSKDTTDGITLTDPTNGVFQISIAAADTSALDPGSYTQECELTDSASKVHTIIHEPAKILKDLIT